MPVWVEGALGILEGLAAWLDTVLRLYKWQALLAALGICLLAAFLAPASVVWLARRRKYRILHTKPVRDAARLADWYLDRPLRAEARERHRRFAAYRSAVKLAGSGGPPCGTKNILDRAVLEGWYNEYLSWSLEQEIRRLESRTKPMRRAVRRAALKELRGALRAMPRGISIRHAWTTAGGTVLLERKFRMGLERAMDAADAMDGRGKTDISRKSAFGALVRQDYACARCRAPWEPGAGFAPMSKKDGTVKIFCRKCGKALLDPDRERPVPDAGEDGARDPRSNGGTEQPPGTGDAGTAAGGGTDTALPSAI